MAIGAKPLGARESVEPRMTIRKPNFKTISAIKPEPKL